MVGMPKSIQRGFIVGDRHFLTYDEAQKFAAANRANLLRAVLIRFLKDQIEQEPFAETASGIAEPIADALLEFYEMKPRKTRNE